MSKLMILGASVYQVPLIEKTKELGIEAIVSSIPGDYPGFGLADKVYYTNTIDKAGIHQICVDEKIDGITTTGTDVAVSTIGYVNDKLSLAGISEEAAVLSTDKAKMKQAFEENGVSASKFVRTRSFEEAKAAASEIGYPVVVKCVDSSGSRGITTVSDESELEAAYEAAIKVTRKDYVLVEEMLQGQEIGVDGLVAGGEIIFIAPHLKFTHPVGGVTITAGHAFPFRCSEELNAEIIKQMKLAVAALKIDNCAFNADVFVKGDEAFVIEVGGRCGATCIPELISKSHGFDYYEAIIACSLGQDVSGIIKGRVGGDDLGSSQAGGIEPHMEQHSEPQIQPHMAKLLMSPIDGELTRIDAKQLDVLRQTGVDIKIDFPEGHPIEKMINGTTRIGHVIAKAETEEEFDAVMKRVYACLYVNGKSLEELWEM